VDPAKPGRRGQLCACENASVFPRISRLTSRKAGSNRQHTRSTASASRSFHVGEESRPFRAQPAAKEVSAAACAARAQRAVIGG
jgi:hypothetical protein